jgi:glutathione-regulated potassium-efflux system ancillary protein KefF
MVRASTRMPTMPTCIRPALLFGASSSRKVRVAKMSKTLGCSGTTTLSASFSGPPELARIARQPPPAGDGRAAGPRACTCRTCTRAYPDYDIDVRAEQAGQAPPAGAAAPDPVVFDAGPDEAVAGRRAGATAGPTAPGGTALRARTCGWWPPPAAPRPPTTRRATTATSSTPSCRPTSRPRRCAACASCRRCCCTAPTARAATESGHAAVFAERLRSYPDWPEIDDLPPARVRRAHDRPARETGARRERPDGTRTRPGCPTA